MEPFSVGEHTYRAERMDAMTQFHVVRRLSPILGSLREMLDMQGREGMDSVSALSPLAQVASSLPDEHVNYIINAALSLVKRQLPGDAGWAPIWNRQVQKPMYEDMSFIEMLQVAGRVIMDSIGPFSLGSGSISGVPLPK